MKKLIKNKFIILIICVIIVSLIYFCLQKVIDNYIFNTNNDIISEEDVSVEQNTQIPIEETDFVVEEAEEAKDEKVEKEIYIHITGEVNSPGVVVLNEGSRIVDAINAAGGTTTKADITKVNLVYVLEDGMKVNIPNKDDLKKEEIFEYITKGSGDEASEEMSTGNTNSGSKSVVNINTATQTELETLPGIGPSLALKIINYRKENGKFTSIEQIKEVSGIGDSKFEELKKHIGI